MTRDVKQFCKECETCIKGRRIQHQPLMATVLLEWPREMLGVDLMTCNHLKLLVVADYYSRWIEVLFLRGRWRQRWGKIGLCVHQIWTAEGGQVR